MFIGDWGLGIGDCNPQSPIPNPHVIYFICNTITYNTIKIYNKSTLLN